MAAKPANDRGDPRRAGEPLKRPSEVAVPVDWLRDAEHDELADRLDRLQGDADLVTSLALQKYEGPLWEYFSNEIAKYGFAVLKSWIATGVIFERCKSRGFGLKRTGRDFTQDDIEGLAGETVAKALFHFRRDVLMASRWDPTKGASLRTFFIGQCLIRFPNIYRSWVEAQESDRQLLLTGDEADLDLFAESLAPVERRVIAEITSSHAMSEIKDPRVRRAMYMTADGFPQADIARVLGLSRKAVERMIANERDRLRKRGIG